MQSNLTRVIITATILLLILGGVSLGYSLYNKPSSDDTLSSLGVGAKELSSVDVAKHATSSSCWTIVGGSVYDATSVLKNNPKQADVLVKACGVDGSAIYTVQKYTQNTLDDETIAKLKEELFANRLGIIAPSN